MRSTVPQNVLFATADLMDEYEAMTNCPVQFRSYGRRKAFHGPMATIRCREDNGLVKAAVAEPGHGRVLVVDGGGSMHTALVGDNVAGTAAGNGWAGIVVNGAVRDTAALALIDIGVQALGTSPRRPSHQGVGESGVPVSCGGTVFFPGHWLFCDEDGVVMSPPEGFAGH